MTYRSHPAGQISVEDALTTGLYILANLDGTPLDPKDSGLLGLHMAAAFPEESICAAAVDAEDIGAADVARIGNSWCCFLGEIENPEEIAANLGCESVPAAIALAAMRNWGAKTSDKLKGEWSLAYWDGHDSSLWLGASRLLRDRIYYACDSSKVAISGDLLRLASVSWVGSSHDPAGVAYALGNSAIRAGRAGRTIFKNIFDLEPGTFHRFAADSSHRIIQHRTDSPIASTGGFNHAVNAIEQRLRFTTNAILARHQRVAILLSGGLDSAIVTRFVAEMKTPDHRVIALTAAAPMGSDLQDENALAAEVADAFGIEQQPVWPSETARIFRPDSGHFADGRLNLSPRHYLDHALLASARAFGATAILDGMEGESSVSASAVPHRFVDWLREMKRRVAFKRQAASGNAYLIPPSQALLAALPEGFGTETLSRPQRSPSSSTSEPRGLTPGYDKSWRSPTSVPGGGIRRHSLLRDRELVRMVAGMPAGYTRWQGHDRALARALLRGHLPDHIVQQKKGLAFSVDYDQRFRDELPQILPRAEAWRQAGVDDWIDIDWIETEVSRLMAMEAIPVHAKFPLQLAALAAEYFLQVRTGQFKMGR